MNLLKYTQQNKLVLIVIFIYSIGLLLTLKWGAPSPTHPFPYHMDEWHQLAAVRSTFKYGTPNIEGSAHGAMFQFILTGFYLLPFYLLHIIDIFSIKSSVGNLLVQQKLFEILRLNTLIFGVLSILMINKIAKRYLKIPPLIPVLLFVCTPVWITLSGIFKYDIALVFWIVFSLSSIFAYIDRPSDKRFYLSTFISALALATKVSAVPQFILLIVIFYIFTKTKVRRTRRLLIGLCIFILTFLIVGVSDIFFHFHDYIYFFHDNLVTTPATDQNYILGLPLWVYQLTQNFPHIFGYVFYSICLLTLVGWSIYFLKVYRSGKKPIYKYELVMYIGLILYILSIFPLGLTATGNRLLVLLPFLSLLSGSYFYNFLCKKRNNYVLYGIFVICIAYQLYASSIFILAKLSPNPPEESSMWIVKYLPPHSEIGLENIPIYQSLPNIVLKEYYAGQEKRLPTRYVYHIIDASSSILPKTVIITDSSLYMPYVKQSGKEQLINRLQKEKFHLVASFPIPHVLSSYFMTYLNYRVSGLYPVADIKIYQK